MFWALTVGLGAAGAEAPVEFRRQVLPLLSERCFRCHGPDAERREAGLRLDLAAAATAPLDSGHRAVVPGRLDQSQLWQRINEADADRRMPPPDTTQPLTESQHDLLRRWIEQGATYTGHWSFEPPRWQPPPHARAELAEWPRQPLDCWGLERLDAHGLRPNAPADRATLMRRVSLDLIGLPPTPAEVDDFLGDARPNAYERVVERLLASPEFGARWAYDWLDLARYADSAGYAQDPPRIIWRYRDWVISAINRNLPFDQFTIEQLAGDLLPNPSDEQLLATAFHRNTMTNSEGGTDDEEFRVAAVVDRVNTTMQVWMGLTMGCAQCHSHKYDPITQQEYFQVLALFNNTADADRGDESPLLTEYTAAERQTWERLDAQIKQLETQLAKLAAAASGSTPSSGETTAPASTAAAAGDPPATDSGALEQQLKELRAQLAAITGVATPIVRELPADQQRVTRVHIRGNFLNHGSLVAPGVPAAFVPLPAGTRADRLALARWLVDPSNPLTARVTVNHWWEQLFGEGLVETAEDFGLLGDPPSHPELLDYLALELIRSGWDRKQILRAIVTSATYRQSSQVTEEKRQSDPRNRLLSRGPSHRLPAEMLRDQALAIAGLLSHKQFGPSVQPPRPRLGLSAAFGGSTDWETSPGEDRYRRGLYTSWRRTTPYPSLTTFDAPSREVCTIRRIRTNTPLQAFVTLNDPAFVEAAQGLARRICRDCNGTPRERLNFGLRLCLAREATAQELDRLETFYQSALDAYRKAPDAGRRMAEEPLGPTAFEVDLAELAAWTVTANVLLNLDELLSKT